MKSGSLQPAPLTKKQPRLFADIMPIDGLIGFAGSDAGKALFGEERAAAILAHAKDIKEKGARFCDCPACSACAEIIGTLK